MDPREEQYSRDCMDIADFFRDEPTGDSGRNYDEIIHPEDQDWDADAHLDGMNEGR